jgi:hypothetical protein
LRAIFKRIEHIFSRATFRATMYSARRGIDSRGEKQCDVVSPALYLGASIAAVQYHFVVAVWRAKAAEFAA